MGNKHLLFVYGTLRKHCTNHHFLKGATLVAEQARTKGELYDTESGYPALRFNGHENVYGELYEVDDILLASIDMLEGYEQWRDENLYERTISSIRSDRGDYKAIVYYMSEKNDEMLRNKIDSGDWKRYEFERNNTPYFYYFAFGSCMDMERMKIAEVDHLFSNVTGAGKLPNYEICYRIHRPDGGRADISETGKELEGIVYYLPYEALQYLYEREGVYTGMYRPIFVDITIGEKQFINVLSFTVINKKNELTPPDHYAIEILRGAKGRVSKEYFAYLTQHMENLGVNVHQLLKKIEVPS
ncbi:gamma-glutamylcyclotransferase [Evansella halocellulosilytica]|uniref:gamma-glutamylcyclotransferase n=1 Tax=Evansella halocellulosilytica TaxID=2011013 RepID=UPI000BB925AC|nr:gamma-glutamylcyclotransferase family protein [Evansella halocellulosilytica]